MSEFLRSNPESFEFEQNQDRILNETAVNGLSRVAERYVDNKEEFDANHDDGGEEYDDESDEDYGYDGEEYDDESNEDYDYDGEEYDDESDEDYDYDGEEYDDESDEEYGYDDDDYYSEYEEQHYGEERIDFDEEKLVLREIPLPTEILECYSFLNDLPHGVAVMGGIARSIAREMITGEREPIRDIDLVNILDEEGNSENDHETLDMLSRKYMPDDDLFGHSIRDETLEHYFDSRDFTINQSLIMDGKLIFSNFAYNDFQENIIRPTYFEHPYDGEDIGSRLFLKAIMMRSVISQISDSIPLIEDMQPPHHVKSFDIALFLNKAMSRGAKTARIFTEDLVDWDVITEEYSGRPIALAKALHEDVYPFEFHSSADERFKDVEECSDMDGFFAPPTISEYHASNQIIRRAIAEYEDGLDESIDSGEERVSGYYTQAEYDEINRSSAYDDNTMITVRH